MEPNALYQGDCLKLFSQVESAKVDLVFADPPFNIGYEYDVYDDRKGSEDYLGWSRKWGSEVARILKPNGSFWLAIGDEYAAELKLMFQSVGFFCRSWVVWYYTFGVNCKKKFSRSHTHVFYFVKDLKNHTFNGADIRIPSARQLVYADSRADSGGKMPDDTWILRPQDLPDGFTPNHDVWYFPRVCGTFKERAGWHGCQMPEQLLGRIIRVSSSVGDLVLDPFSGSGTTLVAAKKLGRQWIGFELSNNYVCQVKSRLDLVESGQPLEGAEEPKVSAPSTANGKALATFGKSQHVSQPRQTRAEIDRGILEAFITSRDGYSSDRVLADPELNKEFIAACSRLGVPGEPKAWNTRLLNLRKASHLSGLPRSRKTAIRDEEVDRCEFACEIAIQDFYQRNCSLDQLLCDPEKVAEFDSLVRKMTASDVTSLLIRLVAFRIRKRARDIRERQRILKLILQRPRRGQIANSLDLEAVPSAPGLYWLQSSDRSRHLYVGKTINLRNRFELQVVSSGFDFWETPRSELEIRYRPYPESKGLDGNQSHWIAQWKPQGNYCKLAAV